MTNHRTSPQDAQAIAAHARQHLECADCGAATGEPCEQPGGRIVCKSRYLAAAIALKRQARATPQTSAQEAERTATLASLPRVSRDEIEKRRTPRGGYSFTKAWFLEHGLPYPPIAGWRQAVERDDSGEDCTATEKTGAMTSETIIALRNYDHLVRTRGLDDVVLHGPRTRWPSATAASSSRS